MDRYGRGKSAAPLSSSSSSCSSSAFRSNYTRESDWDRDDYSTRSSLAAAAASIASGSGGSDSSPASSEVKSKFGYGGQRVRGRTATAAAAVAASLVATFFATAYAGLRTGRALSAGGESFQRSLRLKQSPHPEERNGLDNIGSGSTMLLGIFSMRTEKEAKRRQLVRDTYLTHGKDPRICYLSLYQHMPSEERRHCNVVYTFVVGANDDGPTEHVDDTVRLTLNRAKVDGSAEDDVTYLNVRENMEDGKSDTWFKYGAFLSDSYDIDYVAKTDSDSYVNVDELIDFVTTELPPSPHNVHTYGGIPWPNFHGNSIYMAGQFYFMSADLARYVGYTLTPEEKRGMRKRIEDLDMGTFIFSSPHPIKFVICNSRMFWHHSPPLKTEEQWKAFVDEHGPTGRPAWRTQQLNWRAIANIWAKQGLVDFPEDKKGQQ